LSNPPNPASEQPSQGFIVLATVVRPHGLKGEVKVSLSCSGVGRLASCRTLRLVRDGRELKRATVIRSFMHPDGDAVVRLKEVQGVEEAESLRGAQLAVLPGEQPALPEGSYYLDDLVGLSVTTPSGQSLGLLEEILEGPANAVCVIRDGEREILVPALKSVIREVDLKGRRMVVEPPEEIDADHAD
jgi:16S rRNA processing protein RimM